MVIPGVKAARTAIERMYVDVCTVTIKRGIRDEDTKVTSMQTDILISDQPCRLSYKSISTVSASDVAAKIEQVATLFMCPDISIPPGAEIAVKRENGVICRYHRSGESAVYSTHQEIPLEIIEKRA